MGGLNIMALLTVVKELQTIPPGAFEPVPGGFVEDEQWTQISLRIQTPVARQILGALARAGVEINLHSALAPESVGQIPDPAPPKVE